MAEIEGDVSGLYDIASQITKAKQPLHDSAKAINGTVDALVNDAGWHGDAASSFRAAWERDSTVLGATASLIGDVASAVTDLAHGLSAARSHVYNAQDAAQQAGVAFSKDGEPDPGPLTGAAATARTTCENAVRDGQRMAQEARDAAKRKLYAVLVSTTPGLPGSTNLLSTQDAAGLAALLHDYVYLPEDMQRRELTKQLATFQHYYDEVKFDRKHAGDAGLKRVLGDEMKDMRAEMKSARADLASVAFYEDEIKKGKWFNTSLGDVFEKLGKDSRWIRIADQVLVLDAAAVTIGTYAQAKYDHDRGWGWTHAVVADGGANIAGVAAEILTAETGPFAPVIGYGVTSLINEYTHNTHWARNIHDHGVVAGVGRSLVEGVVVTAKSDFADMSGKVVDSAEHPIDTAKNIWHGVFG
ncbi:hypothetical protein ACWGCW_22320 [Streptomyces sp. NPDC054933]